MNVEHFLSGAVGDDCVPLSCSDLNPGQCAINYPDGCGGTFSCSCKNGPCFGTKCIECQKKTCLDDYPGQCGSFDDGCGGTTACPCFPGTECVNGKCAKVCTPSTCEALGAECGEAPDGCGNVVFCGTCPNGKTCKANKCGMKPVVGLPTIQAVLQQGQQMRQQPDPNAAADASSGSSFRWTFDAVSATFFGLAGAGIALVLGGSKAAMVGVGAAGAVTGAILADLTHHPVDPAPVVKQRTLS